jgi:hypothetical protein
MQVLDRSYTRKTAKAMRLLWRTGENSVKERKEKVKFCSAWHLWYL